MSAAIDTAAIEALVTARHGDPFAVLGAQRAGNGRVIRTLQPQAATVELLDRHGQVIGALRRLHPDGLFEGPLPARMRRYALRVTGRDGGSVVVEDPYRFAPSLGEVDRYLLAEGSHQRLHATLGATLRKLGGVAGTRFAVWAPNAGRVSVVGTFNDWDARRHPMRLHPGSGVWEIFLPGVGPGALYKFDLLDAGGQALPQKCDPVGSFSERPPGNASIVYESNYQWGDADWMARRRVEPDLARPVSIYEVHLGSWRRRPEDGDRWLTYRELADQLIPYAVEMGFTHLELMPITEHPFDGSWGYQPTGMFAPTSRFGTPDDFRYLVDRCHLAGLAVIVDWVAAHFPRDDYGLARFDGTALYEHADPRRGEHGDWGTLIYNYGRREVANFLLGSALCWIDEFHIDGLRVDAVASMLYLDYSRTDGAWLPNEHGGNENLEAVAFLKRLNVEVHGRGAVTFAEESTAWPGVSRPTYDGGLGFTYKWNMGWMNDTLRYMSEEPVHRKYHHDKMTFGPVYAFTENFVLPLSHDEVVHGKKSLLGRMPGDEWQRFANLRAYLGSMFAYPGKKLLFMGAEFAQEAEWNHDRSLDWHLATQPLHAGMQRLVTELNRVYAYTPALHEIDFQAAGFEWIDWQDADDSVLSWIRYSASGQYVICVVNFTPVVRYDYCIGVPEAVRYVELCNTDDRDYGGSGRCPFPPTTAECREKHDRPAQLTLTLPPLATVYLVPERQAGETRTRNC